MKFAKYSYFIVAVLGGCLFWLEKSLPSPTLHSLACVLIFSSFVVMVWAFKVHKFLPKIVLVFAFIAGLAAIDAQEVTLDFVVGSIPLIALLVYLSKLKVANKGL